MKEVFLVIKYGRKYNEFTIHLNDKSAQYLSDAMHLNRSDEFTLVDDHGTGNSILISPSTMVFMTQTNHGEDRSIPEYHEAKLGCTCGGSCSLTQSKSSILPTSTSIPPQKETSYPDRIPRLVSEKTTETKPMKGTPEFYEQTARFMIVCKECNECKYARLWKDSTELICNHCHSSIYTGDYVLAKITCSCCNRYYEIYLPADTQTVNCGTCGSPIDLQGSSKGNF